MEPEGNVAHLGKQPCGTPRYLESCFAGLRFETKEVSGDAKPTLQIIAASCNGSSDGGSGLGGLT
jgi:hypothetical protein